MPLSFLLCFIRDNLHIVRFTCFSIRVHGSQKHTDVIATCTQMWNSPLQTSPSPCPVTTTSRPKQGGLSSDPRVLPFSECYERQWTVQCMAFFLTPFTPHSAREAQPYCCISGVFSFIAERRSIAGTGFPMVGAFWVPNPRGL